MVTKSGSNDVHGTAWWAFEKDGLNARNFFDAGKPDAKRNQYGIEAGGPVVSDKLFWYGSYEGIRANLNSTARGNVPNQDG